MSLPKVRVAAAHVAPVYLDRSRTIDKACALIREAAAHGAALVAFPESFVPGFPMWAALAAPIANHQWFARFVAESMRLPGPELERLATVARECGVFVSIGISEAAEASVGSIWNTNLLIGDDGRLLNHHRKLVPTFYEKLIWTPGDGAGLRVVDTRIGKLGMLICGENTNPLARYALIAQGEQLHVSSYPPVWPTRDPKGDPKGGGNYNLETAIRIRAGAHSFEGKLFNVVASAFLDRASRDLLAALGPDAARVLDETPRGVSLVIGPTGDVVSDVLRDDEGLLYCDIDLQACVEPKQFHDVVGYYNRFDIFDVKVDRTRIRPITFCGDDEQAAAPRAAASDARVERTTPERVAQG